LGSPKPKKPTLQERETCTEAPALADVADVLVRIKDLRKTYTEGIDERGNKLEVKALRGIEFNIHPGEFIAITGPNGSGKSTLVNCLGALEAADNTENDPIEYSHDGQLRSVWWDPEWYRQNFVGIVFQDFHLLPTLRVDQNVEFPLRLRQCRHYQADGAARTKLVENALKLVGIEKHKNKLVSQISGGERQRVAIARALVKEPRLLLADEPTGNLDREHKITLVRQLRDLAKDNLSVLMVTHDHELVKGIVDRTIHLVDGAIVNEPSDSYKPARQAPPEKDAPFSQFAPPADDNDTPADCSANPPADSQTEAPAEDAAAAPDQATPVPDPSSTGSPEPDAPATSRATDLPDAATSPDGAGAAEDAPLPAAEDNTGHEQLPVGAANAGPRKSVSRRPFSVPGCSQSLSDIFRYSLLDTRQSTVSLASNVFAILLGTFLTAILLALLGGTAQYVRYLFRTIPGIDSVQVWVDYSTGEPPLTGDEVARVSHWAGAVTAVSSVNQFVPLFQKPTREVIASLFSTQPGDPEVERLPLAAGSRTVNPEGWDIILPMRIAEEMNNFNPKGLAGSTVTLQLRRYARTASADQAKPTQTLDYPVRIVGIVQASPQDRVYGSLNMVRFVRDFSTGRSAYVAEPGVKIDPNQISPRTVNESLRIHFDGAVAAERAFLEMKHGRNQRFEASWPGERMLYLRDVETVSTIVLIGIGLLAIVAGAVSVFNTLLASVARKTKEIGIMRAMGVARLDVFLIFVFQSIIVGVVASLIGLVLAALAVVPLNAYIAARWEQLTGAMKSTGGLFQFGLGMSLTLIATVIVICLVAALLPSLRAASKTPMDALRES
jgi:putative ABC transport system ATP-binding protein